MKRTFYSWLGTLCLAIAMPSMAQQNEGAPAKSLTSVVMPAAAPLTEERLKQLQLPKGFELLALDTTLDLLPAATRDEVLSAAKGHVVGYGNLMGRYQQAQPPRK